MASDKVSWLWRHTTRLLCHLVIMTSHNTAMTSSLGITWRGALTGSSRSARGSRSLRRTARGSAGRTAARSRRRRCCPRPAAAGSPVSWRRRPARQKPEAVQGHCGCDVPPRETRSSAETLWVQCPPVTCNTETRSSAETLWVWCSPITWFGKQSLENMTPPPPSWRMEMLTHTP